MTMTLLPGKRLESRRILSEGKRWSLIIISFSLLFTNCQKSIDQSDGAVNADQQAQDASVSRNIGINILLKSQITDAILNELRLHGTVVDLIPKINALTMRISASRLSTIKNLSYVSAATPDAERTGSPIDGVAVSDFSAGLSTWNLDAINVTELNSGRTIAQDGTGVYIGVLDTGLPDMWRQYLPQERIATQFARAFGGGGNDNGNVSVQPNKWEHDQNSHGVHVTSTILGFQLGGAYLNGVAPKATIIPVKVLGQTGRGYSSVIARGVMYMTELKSGPLRNSPVVINMSLGGPQLDAIEKAAIDYAIANGVIVVASAGNNADDGMSYPGGYAPVISVASAGWIEQWKNGTWWYASNFPDPTAGSDLFISTFSARAKPDQDLDVAAPGDNIVGPYQTNSGQISYFFLSGTSMAAPHVSGIVALMAQVRPGLTAGVAETALVAAAAQVPIGAGSRTITDGDGVTGTISWPANAASTGFVTATAALSALP